MAKEDLKQLTIVLKTGVISFLGKYRRDLEKPNWHYYETKDKDIFHFRKDQMVCVLENAKNNKAVLDRDYDIV